MSPARDKTCTKCSDPFRGNSESLICPMCSAEEDNEKKAKELIYKFHWKDGKVEEAKGIHVTAAFTSLGYGAGALSALDYYEVLEKKK